MATLREMKRAIDLIPAERLIQIGLPDVKWYYRNGEYQALCPFHTDTKLGNFGYNPSKNLWKCFVCGKGGAGPISLVMQFQGWDFKTTVKFLYEHRNQPTANIDASAPYSLQNHHKKTTYSHSLFSNGNGNPVVIMPQERSFTYHSKLDPRDVSLIYQSFSEASPLTEEEKRRLCKKRGLWYRSTNHFFRFPSPFDFNFRKRFCAMLDKNDPQHQAGRLYHLLLGVPGFFWDSQQGDVSFVGYKNSVGILNHDNAGFINGIELRLNSKDGHSMRYMPFSSEGICCHNPERFSNGTNLGSIVDVVPKEASVAADKGIAITEGKFKALHLSYLGYTVLNVHGIGNWRKALPVLESMVTQLKNTPPISIAFDADSRANPPVANHSMQLGLALMEAGYQVSYLTWPAKFGKGIDDLVNSGHTYRLRSVDGQRFIETTLAPFLERTKKHNQIA